MSSPIDVRASHLGTAHSRFGKPRRSLAFIIPRLAHRIEHFKSQRTPNRYPESGYHRRPTPDVQVQSASLALPDTGTIRLSRHLVVRTLDTHIVQCQASHTKSFIITCSVSYGQLRQLGEINWNSPDAEPVKEVELELAHHLPFYSRSPPDTLSISAVIGM